MFFLSVVVLLVISYPSIHIIKSLFSFLLYFAEYKLYTNFIVSLCSTNKFLKSLFVMVRVAKLYFIIIINLKNIIPSVLILFPLSIIKSSLSSSSIITSLIFKLFNLMLLYKLNVFLISKISPTCFDAS